MSKPDFLASELEAGAFGPSMVQNEQALRIKAAAELRRLAAIEAERDKEKAARQDAQRQLYEERARLYEMVSAERVKTSQALSERDQLRAEVEALRSDAAAFPKLRAFVQGYSMELWKAFERRNG